MWQKMLARVWYLHPQTTLIVALAPALAINVLATAAKPSTDRLQLRNVFAQGRRYFIQSDGTTRFRLMTTSKVAWHYQRRTQPVSVMSGLLTPLDSTTSRIELHSHVKAGYLVQFLFVPVFITSLIVYMPWGIVPIIGLSTILFVLSWLSHRYNAILEAQEMIFFVEKAFEEFMARPAPLSQGHANTLYQADFTAQWERFYQQERAKETPPNDTQKERS